jgi:hypothetical protein
MKVKSLALSAAAAVVIPVAGLAAPVFADSPGQVETGDIYRVKNVTQNIAYATSVKANACDELQYSARLHNPGYGQITNVIAKTSLSAGSATTNTSNVSVTWSNGIGSGASASVNVNLTSAQSVSYENGSAQLLDVDGNVIKALPDGITNGGVNLGSLNGSTTEYVIFKAKVSCPTTPPVTPPTTPPATVTTTSTPTTLVNTGAGSVVGIFAAAVAFGAVAYRVVLSRRLSRQ